MPAPQTVATLQWIVCWLNERLWCSGTIYFLIYLGTLLNEVVLNLLTLDEHPPKKKSLGTGYRVGQKFEMPETITLSIGCGVSVLAGRVSLICCDDLQKGDFLLLPKQNKTPFTALALAALDS